MLALKQPSDLYDAMLDTLQSTLAEGVTVADYADLGTVKIVDALVLIEFEQSTPAPLNNDGRFCHQYDITLHAVLGRHRQRPALDALNLAAVLERVVNKNLWNLPSTQIDWPENIRAAPSLFKPGTDGFESWGVSFSQAIYLGNSLLKNNPIVTGVWLAINPDNPDDETQYEGVNNAESNLSNVTG